MTIPDEDENVALWVERLTAAAEQGKPLDLAEGLPSTAAARDPANGDEWGPERQIPAAALRRVLVNGKVAVDPHGIRITGARIIGPLDLENVAWEHVLHLTKCRIEHPIELSGSTLKELNLNGSRIQSLMLNQATVTGNVIAGERFTATGGVRAPGAKIEGQLILRDARLANPSGDALSFDWATIHGDVFADEGFTATGEVRAPGAKIGGQLVLDGATLTNPTGSALNLDQATIAGGVIADKGLAATGEFRAVNANVGGQLVLQGAACTNLFGPALNLDQATIAGGVFACNGFTATGEFRAIDAKLGQLFLDRATLTNPTGRALYLDRATISGGVIACEGFVAAGEVRVGGARIDGQFLLNGAQLTNPGGAALYLGQATISGGVIAIDGFAATGEIRAPKARIDGQLSLNGATLTNPAGYALNLDQATITGDVAASEGFTTTGQVHAPGAKIDGLFLLDGATLVNPDGVALDLKSSIITTLTLIPARIDGTTDLTRAVITDLRTPPNSQPPGQLLATGWQIADVHGLIRTDRPAAARWLKSAPAGHGFTAQPWHALAAVYDRNGQPADARRLRFTAANRSMKQAPRSTKPLSWLYLLVAGHGYYPLLAAVWLVGALLLGWCITDHNTEHFIPTDRAAADKAAAAQAAETHALPPQPITAAESCTRYPGYPCFSAFNYALAGVVPAATGVPKYDWTIQSTAPVLLSSALVLLRILAWIFTAILIAGVTGLLRKT